MFTGNLFWVIDPVAVECLLATICPPIYEIAIRWGRLALIDKTRQGLESPRQLLPLQPLSVCCYPLTVALSKSSPALHGWSSAGSEPYASLSSLVVLAGLSGIDGGPWHRKTRSLPPLLTLPYHIGSWTASPLKTPNTALTQVLDKIGPKAGETGALCMPNRRIDKSVAGMLGPQLPSQALAYRVSDRGIAVQSWFDRSVGLTQVVKWAKKVGDQFSVIGDVFKTTDSFQFTGQMV
jgi:hypothetical protein